MFYTLVQRFGCLAILTTQLVACNPQQPNTDLSLEESSSNNKASGDAIKIGALLPMTGDLQSYGEASLDGINLATAEINAAGGVRGNPLKIVIGDTQTASQPSIDAAQKLVSVDGVVGLIGAMSSGNTIPVAQSISSINQILHISNASSSPVITTLQDDDFLFRTVPSDAFQGIALAKVAQEQDLDQLAIIYINNDYGEGFADSFRTAFEARGKTITEAVPYEPGQASYRGELQQLASQGATALVVLGYPKTGITILKQSLEEGFFDTFVLGDGMKDPELITALGAEALDGAFGTVPQATTESATYQTFNQAYIDQFGAAPDKPYIDTSYDATMLMALALEQADSTEDGIAIRDALRLVANAPGIEVGPGEWDTAITAIQNGEDIDYTGASGLLEFDESGDVGGSFAHWAIQGGEIVTVKVFDVEQ